MKPKRALDCFFAAGSKFESFRGTENKSNERNGLQGRYFSETESWEEREVSRRTWAEERTNVHLEVVVIFK